jgi:hypothetical protein
MKTHLATTLALVLFASAASAQSLPTPTSTLRKGIIPLVGSTRGAYGSSFKTSLRINALPGAHGRIVFHPLGTVARDDDPSIPYSFAENVHAVSDFLQFDDIVGALGRSGLGTLDIVPDAFGGNILPTVTARVYNDTPAGTYGTDVPLVLPRDYFFNLYATDQAEGGLALFSGRTVVPPMAAVYRRNVGFRTLSDVELQAVIIRKDGTQEPAIVGSFPGEYSTMMPIEEFVRQFMGGRSITADDGLVISTRSGRAIVFYTYTDNRTNDPSMVVTPAVEANVLLNDVP